VSRTSRARAALGVGLREYVRTPLLLVLLVFLPAYFVAVLVQVAPDGTVPVDLPGGSTTAPLADAFAVMMAPMSVALVTGIAGLFLMQSAREADARLAVAGFGAPELVAGRLGLLGVVAAAVTGVATAVALAFVAPETLAWFVAGAALVAVTYGMVGLLAGIALDRLPGVYLLLFGPTLDVFLFQNPTILDPHPAAALLPGHYGMDLAVAGGFGNGGSLDTLALGVAYLLALGVLAALALYRSLGVD
jgi:ABC-2 type transport system permease protein